MDDECVHGLGEVAACVLCNGRARREAKQEALEREVDGDRRRMLARVMAGKARAQARQLERMRLVRDGAWESESGLSDDLMLPGGAIDDRGPVRPTRMPKARARHEVTGFYK
jgi:hypothetical protein